MNAWAAAALIGLCLEADGREHEAMGMIRRVAPYVDPNRLMLELADEYLGREGRLVAAGAPRADLADSVPSFDLVVLPRTVRGAT